MAEAKPEPEAEPEPEPEPEVHLPSVTVALPLFVPSREEALTIKKAFELRSGIKYVRLTKYTGKEIAPRSIHFVDRNGVVKENEHPFIIVKTDIFECMYGRDRHAARKLKELAKEEERLMEDHPLPLKRTYRKSQASRKKGCPATMVFKEVILLTDYKMKNTSEWEKRQMSKAIHSAVGNGEVTGERRVYIKYPTDESHHAFHEIGPITMDTYLIRKAGPDDCEDIVRLIKELAEYESMPDQVDMTPEKLRGDAFCAQPYVNLLVAVCAKSNTTVGYSSFSYTYSSWKGRTVYLDDVYVTPAHRGTGLGTSLMQSVAKCAYEERNCNRMNWIVLAWNERPKELYARIGGENLTVKECWENITLFEEQLKNFATNYKVKIGANTVIDVQL